MVPPGGVRAPLTEDKKMQFDKERKRSKLRIEYRSNKRTWVGRIKFGDGARTPIVDMMTDDERLAQERYDAWFATGVPPCGDGKQSFETAATAIVEPRALAGEPKFKERMQRLRDHVFARMGFISVANLEPHHVSSVLDHMKDQGLLAGTQLKVRTDISRVLAELVRKGVLRVNVAREVGLHEDAEDDTRERMQLTDEETLEFRRQRGFASELDMLALHARDLAASRTSDLHAERWEHWDLSDFATVNVRRPKTDDTPDDRGRTPAGRRRRERGGRRRASRSYEWVTHRVQPHVAAATRAWWVAEGSKLTGPVFPVRKGERAGCHKRPGTSYVEAYRAAVWACGIHRPLPGFDQAVGEEARKKLDAYQTDTETTRALDFHGLRAAAITALCDAGVSDLLIMATVGHSQIKTSAGYRRRITVGMPEAAVPGGGRPAPEAPAPPIAPPPDRPAPATAREAAKTAALDVLWDAVGGRPEREGR